MNRATLFLDEGYSKKGLTDKMSLGFLCGFLRDALPQDRLEELVYGLLDIIEEEDLEDRFIAHCKERYVWLKESPK